MPVVDRKYDYKTICFITCVNDETKYSKLINSIKSLNIPRGMQYECIALRNEKSIFSAYQKAMLNSDAKYKIYVHQDVTFNDCNFLVNVIRTFREYPRYGLLGAIGGKYLDDGTWWNSEVVGAIVDNSITECLSDRRYGDSASRVNEVVAVDGLLLATQYDVNWRIDIFNGWHYYDVSQSMEFRRAGFGVATIPQPITACIHACGIPSMGGWDVARNIFMREYRLEMESINNNYIKPLVTVIIPTYNRPEYLAMAIESVIAQTYTNWELFISDNSPDNRTKIMMENHYLNRYSNIKYEHHPELDFLGNLNICQKYDNPDAEYINYLMEGDVFLPDKLDKMIRVYMHNPDVALVSSHRLLIDDAGEILPNDDNINKKLADIYRKFFGEYAGKCILTSMQIFIGVLTTVLIKKEHLRKNNLLGWSGLEGQYLVTDYSTWLQCLNKGNWYYIPEPLSGVRQYAPQNTFSKSSSVTVPICYAVEVKYAIDNHIFLETEEEIMAACTNLLLITQNGINVFKQNMENECSNEVLLLSKLKQSIKNAIDNDYNIDLSFLELLDE